MRNIKLYSLVLSIVLAISACSFPSIAPAEGMEATVPIWPTTVGITN